MKKNRTKIGAFLILLMLYFPAAIAVGKTIPICVQVSIAVNALTSAWAPGMIDVVQADARKRLTIALKKKHPHWDFRDDGVERRVFIKLTVLDPDPLDASHEAELKLEVSPSSPEEFQPVRQPWLPPEDFDYHRFPKSHEMAAKLEEAFIEKFLENRTVALRKWLRKYIALAEGAQWLPAEGQEPMFRVVLSLPYDTFKALEESYFLILGKAEQGTREKLKAQGMSQAAPYPPGSENEQYLGLLVTADTIMAGDEDKDADERVLHYRLGPVFLYKEELPRKSLMALFEEDEP